MNNAKNYKEKYLKYKLKYLNLQNNSNIHNNLIKKYKSKLKIIKGGAISLEEYLNSQGVNLEVKNVPDDGNCLFYAIIDQLQLFKISNNMDIDGLRASAVDWLSKNANNSYSTGPGQNLTIKETVLFDVSVLEPHGIQKNYNNKWETYITKMKQNKAWGDQFIIHAIHKMLQINIIIYTDKKITHSYVNRDYTNRIKIGYVNMSHYVSLVPKKEGTHDGEYEGTHDGEYEGEYDGEYEGEYEGEYDGEYEGTCEGEYDGTQDGKKEGTYDGKKEGTYDGEYTEFTKIKNNDTISIIGIGLVAATLLILFVRIN